MGTTSIVIFRGAGSLLLCLLFCSLYSLPGIIAGNSLVAQMVENLLCFARSFGQLAFWIYLVRLAVEID